MDEPKLKILIAYHNLRIKTLSTPLGLICNLRVSLSSKRLLPGRENRYTVCFTDTEAIDLGANCSLASGRMKSFRKGIWRSQYNLQAYLALLDLRLLRFSTSMFVYCPSHHISTVNCVNAAFSEHAFVVDFRPKYWSDSISGKQLCWKGCLSRHSYWPVHFPPQ